MLPVRNVELLAARLNEYHVLLAYQIFASVQAETSISWPLKYLSLDLKGIQNIKIIQMDYDPLFVTQI